MVGVGRLAIIRAVTVAAALAPLCYSAAQTPIRLPAVRGLDEFLSIPETNPMSLEALTLGRRLFYDDALSRNHSKSCASCHLPERSFADTARRSRGIGAALGARNASAILNRAYGTSFFWDGRASSLERQVIAPIENPVELGAPIALVVARLRGDSSYVRMFSDAFGEFPDAGGLARALATYVRGIRSGDSPLDRYRAGDTTALDESARRGLNTFVDAGCQRCHSGANFTDEDFHNTGVGSTDPGRAAVTGRRKDRGRFKTPTLRDAARTAPYMHDGSLPTLEAVIDFYDRGGGRNPNLDRDIRPLHLTALQRKDLVAFLRALTSSAVTCAPIACRIE